MLNDSIDGVVLNTLETSLAHTLQERPVHAESDYWQIFSAA